MGDIKEEASTKGAIYLKYDEVGSEPVTGDMVKKFCCKQIRMISDSNPKSGEYQLTTAAGSKVGYLDEVFSHVKCGAVLQWGTTGFKTQAAPAKSSASAFRYYAPSAPACGHKYDRPYVPFEKPPAQIEGPLCGKNDKLLED